MLDQDRLFALVAQEVARVHPHISKKEVRCDLTDYRDKVNYMSLESAPYVAYGSPMARYKPMIRLLGDADVEFLKLPFYAGLQMRRERRKIYLGYLADLAAEASYVLSLQAESGAADRSQTQRDRRAIQSALRRLTIAAWMHRAYLPGITDRVTEALQDITGALGYGQILQMPLSQNS